MQVSETLKELYRSDSIDKNMIAEFCRPGQTEPFLTVYDGSRFVDMSLEGMSGCDVCKTIREETAQVALVGMTAFSLDRYCAPALENGASCLVDKANVKALCRALCAIVNGRRADVRYVSSESAQESHERLMAAKGGNISYETFAKREREVMGLCSLGFTSKEIGVKLGIGEPTVKTYIRRVMKKLGAKNRTQAVIQWMEVNSREY